MNELTLIREKITLPLAYSVPPESVKARDAILVLAKGVTTVTSVAAQSSAVEVARNIRRHMKDVEAVRKVLTTPLREHVDKINQLAKIHVSDLERELERIEKVVNVFQDAEDARVAAEEARRIADYESAERERQRLEQAAQDAIKATQTPENAPDDEESYMNARDAAELAARATEKVQQVIDKPLPAVVKASGQSRRRVMRWECLDVNELYKARPDLCKIEPKPSAILAVCVPEIPVPGLKLWWENQTTTRA